MKIEEQENKQKRIKKSRVRWTPDEYRKYLIYIGAQKQKFSQSHVDRAVFEDMAKFIRSPDKTEQECSNFHDRLKNKYRSLDNVIEKLKQLYNVKEEDIVNEQKKRQNIRNKAFEWLIEQNKKDDQKYFSKLKNKNLEKICAKLEETQEKQQSNQDHQKKQTSIDFSFVQKIKLQYNKRNIKRDEKA